MSNDDPITLGLPHREPFVFIDKVVELAPGEHAVCVKTFPAHEPFFRGHFPGDPLVPGVILAEALAQTAGLAAGRHGKSFRLTAIKQMKFLHAVRPDEEIQLTAQLGATMGGLVQFQTKATVGCKMVAEGIIVLSEVT